MYGLVAEIGRNTGKSEMTLCAPNAQVKHKWVQALRTKITPARRAGYALISEGWVPIQLPYLACGIPAPVQYQISSLVALLFVPLVVPFLASPFCGDHCSFMDAEAMPYCASRRAPPRLRALATALSFARGLMWEWPLATHKPLW